MLSLWHLGSRHTLNSSSFSPTQKQQFFFRSCKDDPIAILNDVDSEDACLDECRALEGCKFSTYDGYTQICVLTETCRERDPCGDCVVAGLDNEACDGE